MDEPSDEPVFCEKVKTGLKSGQLHIKIPGSSVGSSDLSPGIVNYQLENTTLPTCTDALDLFFLHVAVATCTSRSTKILAFPKICRQMHGVVSVLRHGPV